MKTSTRALALLLVLGSFLAASARGVCNYPTLSGVTANYNGVDVFVASSASFLSSSVTAAMSQWNDAGCINGYDGQLAHAILSLTSVPDPFAPTILITFENGNCPTAGCGCGQQSGTLDRASSTITIYARSNSGEDCQNSNAAYMTGLVAHELGHYFGLDNNNCTTAESVMAPAVIGSSSRAVRMCTVPRLSSHSSGVGIPGS